MQSSRIFLQRLRVERTDGKGPPSKIQSICNGKCDANYNAKPCAGEGKAAGAGTMASNGKSNAQSNRNSRKSGRVLTSDWLPEDRATALGGSPLG
jgi:hypothetical protein